MSLLRSCLHKIAYRVSADRDFPSPPLTSLKASLETSLIISNIMAHTITAQELTTLSTKAIDAKATAYCMTFPHLYSSTITRYLLPSTQKSKNNLQLTPSQAHTPNSASGHAFSQRRASSSLALMSKMPPIQSEHVLSE